MKERVTEGMPRVIEMPQGRGNLWDSHAAFSGPERQTAGSRPSRNIPMESRYNNPGHD